MAIYFIAVMSRITPIYVIKQRNCIWTYCIFMTKPSTWIFFYYILTVNTRLCYFLLENLTLRDIMKNLIFQLFFTYSLSLRKRINHYIIFIFLIFKYYCFILLINCLKMFISYIYNLHKYLIRFFKYLFSIEKHAIANNHDTTGIKSW